MSREVKIGIFFGIVLLIMAVFIFTVGDVGELFKKEGYPLYIYFDSVAGLERGTLVRMAGVSIGKVKDIRLKGTQAEVIIMIDEGIQVRKDSTATLAALGLLGEKYVEIIPGGTKEYCRPGDTIPGLPSISIDQLGTQLVSVTEEINRVGALLREMIGGDETKSSLKDTLQNLSLFTSDLQKFFQENRESLKQSVDKSASVLDDFDQNVKKLSNNLDELIISFKELIEENRSDIKRNIKDVEELLKRTKESLELLNKSLEKLNKGEGTLGKLLKDPALYDRAEETIKDVEKTVDVFSSRRLFPQVGFQYYGKTEKFRGDLSLDLAISQKSFLFGQIVHDYRQPEFRYSLQGGFRLGDISARAGIIESTMGIGVDYHASGKKAVISLEAFDLNRNPEPRFRLWSRFAPFKSIYLLLGIDDFTLSKEREFFFGISFGY